MKFITALFGVLNFLFSVNAFAAVGEARDWTIHQQYISPRAQGMGGAFTAVADDYYALFYNPAGLARLKEGEVNLELQAMTDSKVLKFYKDVSDASKSANKDQDISNVLQNNYGNHFSFRAPTIGAFWARPGWAFAIIPADLTV